MNFRTRFTKWYYRKGYTIDYDRTGVVYACPWWVKPLTTHFFSPSVYFHEWWDDIAKELDELFEEGSNEHRDSV